MKRSNGVPFPRYPLWAACVAGVLLFGGSSVLGVTPYIELGPADALLLDHPRVQVGVEDPANLGVIVGPMQTTESSLFVLDTAANGMLFAEWSYWSSFNVVDPNLYDVAMNSVPEPVFYWEQGVAGQEKLDVFIPYNFYVADADGVEIPLGPMNGFGKSTIALGDVPGLVGMPAMDGRDVRVNMYALVDIDSDFKMQATFNDVPAVTPTTYTVPLVRLPFAHTGANNADAGQLPTFADIPMIPGGQLTNGGVTVTADVVVDTGAAITFISLATSLGMGIDPDTDAIGFLPVGGLGGSTTVPIVHFDRMALPTNEGVDIVYTNLDVAVIDVAGLDVILGIDALAGAYNGPQLDALTAWLANQPHDGSHGYFTDVLFDFVGPDWSMRLDINPAFHAVTIPEPATLALLAVSGLIVLRRQSKLANVK